MNSTGTSTSTGEPTLDLCVNGTDLGCAPNGAFGPDVTEDFLEQEINYGLRLWHIVFLATGTALSLIILLCCCIKFRIPRTKQEIEADYIRRKILRKFRSRLKAIQNQELDEMDLKCALDKIRAEFKSDTESLAQSEAGFSVGTISSSVLAGEKGHNTSTYRRASQIANEISLEDLRAHSMGIAGRLSLAFSRFFGRSKVGQTSSTAQPKAPVKSKATTPSPPIPEPTKSTKEELNKKTTVTTVDETKKNAAKKPTTDSSKKAKPSTTKDNKDAKSEERKLENKPKDAKEQQKPLSKSTKKEKESDNTKKSKPANDPPPVTVGSHPEDSGSKGKTPKDNSAKDAAKLKKELEKEQKKAKEQLEKEKKEQAKREKIGSEKEKLEKAKQEKEKEKIEKQKKEKEKLEKEKQEKEKLEKQKKEKEKLEKEKQDKEAKKQKLKPEKEPKKAKETK